MGRQTRGALVYIRRKLQLLLTYREHAGISKNRGSSSDISFLEGNLCVYSRVKSSITCV